MDTRTKIVGAAEAQRLAREGATVVSGYFDPVVASHADRLAGLKRGNTPLLVLIATRANAILSAPARAELVAGLAAVDYVCDSPDGIAAEVHLEKEDDARLEKLIEHVHARQRAAL